jgi:hypothetical protein
MTRTFNERVAAWLESQGYPGATDIDVRPHGTDWAGGTESGFYSTFAVDIYFQWGGKLVISGAEGEEMESLWKAIVIDD